MKQIKLISTVLLLMLTAWAVNAFAGPKAVFVQPSFDFKAVSEGTHLTHDFIVKNEGDAPLNITKVQPP